LIPTQRTARSARRPATRRLSTAAGIGAAAVFVSIAGCQPSGRYAPASRAFAIATAPLGTDAFLTESYQRRYDTPFLQASDNPLSTFSIDVDTASYTNVRRFITDGALPPPDAVRVEEMINYFSYAPPPPAPAEGGPIALATEVGPCPWSADAGHRLPASRWRAT